MNVAKELHAISNLSPFTRAVGRSVVSLATIAFILTSLVSIAPPAWKAIFASKGQTPDVMNVLIVVFVLAIVVFWVNIYTDLRRARVFWLNNSEVWHMHMLESLIETNMNTNALLRPDLKVELEKVRQDAFSWIPRITGHRKLLLSEAFSISGSEAGFHLVAALVTRYVWLAFFPLGFGIYALFLLITTSRALA